MDYNANECSLKILDIKNSLVLCSYYAYHILTFFSVFFFKCCVFKIITLKLISKGMLF